MKMKRGKLKRTNTKKAKKSQVEPSIDKSRVKLSLSNTNLIILIFVIALIFLLALSLLFPGRILLAPGELSIERSLPESVNLNQQFTVTLNIYTASDKPAAIGITENIPAGWTIGNIQGTDYSKINNNAIEFLLFSSISGISDTTITYAITPTTTSSTFSGTWESVNPDSSGNIAGDASLTINTASGDGTPGGGGGSGGGGGGGGATTPTQPRTCQENWICSTWNECENEKQTRTCTDANLCGTTNLKPIEQASCNQVIKATQQAVDYSVKHSTQTILILLIASIIVIIIIILIMRKKRKK